jgi:uncharacterized protein (UPF0335 family)
MCPSAEHQEAFGASEPQRRAALEEQQAALQRLSSLKAKIERVEREIAAIVGDVEDAGLKVRWQGLTNKRERI